MKNFSKEDFVTLDEFTKNEYKTMSEYLTTLTNAFADAGIKNLFTEKELKKVAYVADCDKIHRDAYMVMQPTFESLKDFCDKYILVESPIKNFILAQLVKGKVIYRGGDIRRFENKGYIEILKRNIKEYLENPTRLPKAIIKKKDPIKPNTNQSRLKQPRVFTLKDKEELVKPNEETMQALRELEIEYQRLVKADIEQVVDNQNPTRNHNDRYYVSLTEEMESYASAKVLRNKKDQKIRTRAKELTKEFREYREQQDSVLPSLARHKKNMRQFAAFKGNTMKKAIREQDQIIEQVGGEDNMKDRLVESTPIVVEKTKDR